MSGERPCQPYYQTVGSPWWLHGVSIPFSEAFEDDEASKDDDDSDDDNDDEDGDASSSSANEMST